MKFAQINKKEFNTEVKEDTEIAEKKGGADFSPLLHEGFGYCLGGGRRDSMDLRRSLIS